VRRPDGACCEDRFPLTDLGTVQAVHGTQYPGASVAPCFGIWRHHDVRERMAVEIVDSIEDSSEYGTKAFTEHGIENLQDLLADIRTWCGYASAPPVVCIAAPARRAAIQLIEGSRLSMPASARRVIATKAPPTECTGFVG